MCVPAHTRYLLAFEVFSNPKRENSRVTRRTREEARGEDIRHRGEESRLKRGTHEGGGKREDFRTYISRAKQQQQQLRERERQARGLLAAAKRFLKIERPLP